jgi:DDE superfamily endonuclease
LYEFKILKVGTLWLIHNYHFVQVPKTEADWLRVAKEFEGMWNYPNCLGALDGKHVAFRPPRSAGSAFRNYKCFDSIILLALVDAKYRFLYIDVGTNGRVSDGGVFRESDLSKALKEGTLGVPPPKPLPGRETPVPYVIVADDAFSLSTNLMKPYPNRQLSIEQRIHNYRLSRARRVSENVFGIFANRFRIFLGTINLSPEKVQVITLAACALHNFLQMESDSLYMPSGAVDREGLDGLVIPGRWRNDGAQMRTIERGTRGTRSPPEPVAIREEFKAYFNGEGAVAWQNQHIYNT